MKARSAVFDTTDTVVFGSGSVNFTDEALDLEIRPEPKDFSPVALRSPIEIDGTLKHPSFHPKAKQLLARATAAAALFTVAPPAALLALIETGPGEDVDCHGLGPGRKIKDATEADEQRKATDKDTGKSDKETPEPKPPKHP